ncbi:hypothetical protein SDC9_10919 [bioreactor metagenome]|uniref:Uncharacterized protein n=2 Tax=root TaxID=1 RepID=A0A098B648_DESHA|nr:Hypothetical protein DPCES_3954 [Desulfitobacterium hafniense]
MCSFTWPLGKDFSEGLKFDTCFFLGRASWLLEGMNFSISKAAELLQEGGFVGGMPVGGTVRVICAENPHGVRVFSVLCYNREYEKR